MRTSVFSGLAAVLLAFDAASVVDARNCSRRPGTSSTSVSSAAASVSSSSAVPAVSSSSAPASSSTSSAPAVSSTTSSAPATSSTGTAPATSSTSTSASSSASVSHPPSSSSASSTHSTSSTSSSAACSPTLWLSGSFYIKAAVTDTSAKDTYLEGTPTDTSKFMDFVDNTQSAQKFTLESSTGRLWNPGHTRFACVTNLDGKNLNFQNPAELHYCDPSTYNSASMNPVTCTINGCSSPMYQLSCKALNDQTSAVQDRFDLADVTNKNNDPYKQNYPLGAQILRLKSGVTSSPVTLVAVPV